MSKRRRRKVLPQGLFSADIHKLSHDGRGIAHVDGKVTFIDNALPGERVQFEYTFQRKQFDEGRALTIDKPSSDRVEPSCQHADVCGGCSLQHMSSDAQVALKQESLIEQFEHFAQIDIPEHLPVLKSPATGYRRKARLAVKYVEKKGKVLVGFREKRNSFIADIERCAVLVPEVGQRLVELASMIESLDARADIPQIEVAKGDDSVVALVFRHLKDLGAADLDKLKAFCLQHDFHLYLQPKGPESIVRVSLSEADETQMRLYYTLPEEGLRFAFHPCDFTQVNAHINRQMIQRAVTLLAPSTDDVVLDLFCGLGNFSLPLARRAAHVTGVEGSEEMVSRAQENADLNDIANVAFFPLDLEQDLTTLAKQADSWVNRPYSKMLIDPPRSGAQTVVENMQLFPKVHTLVYVSCNPSTLARDAGILLGQGFHLVSAGIMDMFPHTQHVESVALFRRNET